MNKKILTIALIVFALIFVVLLAILMGTISSKTNSANTKLVDTLDMTEGTELNNYNGTVFKGNSVITAINNGKSLGGKLKLFVCVDTISSDGSTYNREWYGYSEPVSGSGDMGTLKEPVIDGDLSDYMGEEITGANTSSAYKVYSAPESTAPSYINETAEFYSALVYNGNDTVVGIHFYQHK